MGWWTSEEMGFGLKDCGAKIVIAGARQIDRIRPFREELGLTLIAGRGQIEDTDDQFDAMVAAGAGKAPPEIEIDPDSDFAIFYTSGSTGFAQGGDAHPAWRGDDGAVLCPAGRGAAARQQ